MRNENVSIDGLIYSCQSNRNKILCHGNKYEWFSLWRQLFPSEDRNYYKDTQKIVLLISAIFKQSEDKSLMFYISFVFFSWLELWIGRFGRMIITTKDGDSNLLRSEVFKELRQIDGMIVNATASYDGESFTYHDICAKSDGECFQNTILNLGDKIDQVSDKINETCTQR